MTRRARPAIFVVSFALVPWGLEACGRGANVLEDDFGGEGGSFVGGQAGGAAGFGGVGGVAGSSKLVEGAGGVGVGGSLGGGGGGGILGPGGGPGPTTGGGPSTGGVPVDQNASRRRELAEELCAIPTAFSCLTLNVYGLPLNATAEDRRVICVENTQSSQVEIFGNRCFLEWQLYAECAVKQANRCPCEGDGGDFCVFTPEVHDFGPGCETRAADLAKCALTTGGSGTERGASGTYGWTDGVFGCSVQGVAKNGVDHIESGCQGSTNGPQSCTCRVNGVHLVDQVLVLTGGDGPFYAKDCRDVAAQLAAGRCADVLDCCYSTKPGNTPGCACGADPELAGFSSCGALASSESGVPVEYCETYRPSNGP